MKFLIVFFRYRKFYNILGNRDYQLVGSVKAQINYQNSNKVLDGLCHIIRRFAETTLGVPLNLLPAQTKMKNKVSQENGLKIPCLKKVDGVFCLTSSRSSLEPMKMKNLSVIDELYQKLVDTGKVDLIISGHENSQQHIYIPGKPDMLISGVGGYTHKEETEGPILLAKELKFRSIEAGCVKIDVKRNQLRISFFNTNNDILYSLKIKKA